MGMYDTVVSFCPECGDVVEFQSKAGDCLLDRFSLDSVPMEIASALDGAVRRCNCGHYVRIEIGNLPTRVMMRVEGNG
jgi:NMD protein affecting ribosome stability and mRNA decay